MSSQVPTFWHFLNIVGNLELNYTDTTLYTVAKKGGLKLNMESDLSSSNLG